MRLTVGQCPVLPMLSGALLDLVLAPVPVPHSLQSLQYFPLMHFATSAFNYRITGIGTDAGTVVPSQRLATLLLNWLLLGASSLLQNESPLTVIVEW